MLQVLFLAGNDGRRSCCCMWRERCQEAEPLTELFGDYLTRCVFSKARPIGQTGLMGFGMIWIRTCWHSDIWIIWIIEKLSSSWRALMNPYDNDPQSRNWKKWTERGRFGRVDNTGPGDLESTWRSSSKAGDGFAEWWAQAATSPEFWRGSLKGDDFDKTKNSDTTEKTQQSECCIYQKFAFFRAELIVILPFMIVAPLPRRSQSKEMFSGYPKQHHICDMCAVGCTFKIF